MSTIKGISHITLICRDIERSSKFIQELFSAKEVYSSDQRNFSISREKFLTIGDLWIALMEGNAIERSYNHIAFHVAKENLLSLRSKIIALGLDILPSRSRYPEEGESIYFYDYDNHLFELHTGDLESRLRFYSEKT